MAGKTILQLLLRALVSAVHVCLLRRPWCRCTAVHYVLLAAPTHASSCRTAYAHAASHVALRCTHLLINVCEAAVIQRLYCIR
jgi:hypothetical protein